MKTELFTQLKYHDEQHRAIDEQLADICKAEIKALIDAGQYQEAKNHVREFYHGFEDFTFEKDLIVALINRQLKSH